MKKQNSKLNENDKNYYFKQNINDEFENSINDLYLNSEFNSTGKDILLNYLKMISSRNKLSYSYIETGF